MGFNEMTASFRRDGFVVVEGVLDAEVVKAARSRFEPLFEGRFETGIQPDEWNWRTGLSAADVPRQICNGWKSDGVIASIVTRVDIVPVEVCAGSAVIHHGRIWHGSRDNRGRNPRRSVIAHCMSSAACFHPVNVSAVYSRYKRHGSVEMDESFFPVLWQKDGYRTPWLPDEQ